MYDRFMPLGGTHWRLNAAAPSPSKKNLKLVHLLGSTSVAIKTMVEKNMVTDFDHQIYLNGYD
jgi:hypothetical protein